MFDPNESPVVLDRDENNNVLLSVKATGERIVTVRADGIDFHMPQTGETLESRVAALEAAVFTTTSTTTAGA
jgi:hypothetical protein